MSEQPARHRLHLARDAAVFQFKLLIDGVRDAVLIPVSLLAALIGLVRGGERADREFRRVLRLGVRSERWIDLFGQRRPSPPSRTGSSLDTLLNRVEEAVMEQYRKGGGADQARAAIREALDEPTAGPADRTMNERSQ